MIQWKRQSLRRVATFVVGLGACIFFAVANPRPAWAPPGCSSTPITFSGVTALDFDTIEGIAGTGTIDLGANGAIAYGAGYAGAGIGVGLAFTVNGTNGCKVSFECDASATMTDGSGNSVTVTNLEIGKTASAFGALTACQGLGTKVLTAQNIDKTYYMGGSVDGTGGIPAGGSYSTSNAGGNRITITVTYDNP